MTFITVHRQSIFQNYKANICSTATFFQLILFVATLGIPIALVAINSDIWPLYTTYYEQPFVRYQQMMLMNLDIGGGSCLTWSTIPAYNRLRGPFFRPGILKTKEEDFNNDKFPDRFRASLDIPLNADEQVFGITIFVFFNLIIQKRTYFEMASVAINQYSAATPGAAFRVEGALRLIQHAPLGQGVIDKLLKVPLLNYSTTNVEDYSISALIERVAGRNVSTAFDVHVPIWTTGAVPGRPFHLDLAIRFPLNSIWMETTILHRLTTAGAAFTFWLLPFWLASWYIRRFVFSHGLISVISDPNKYTMKKYFQIGDQQPT